ncbi:neuronal acetylcholine receptor subunit alpha-10-like [Mytilus galloprovincialis]|uniref:neuronal acetylcholine receptor subunit alpha-10-like n=1 Tax=Mytilus galloprovincialis TaxID=29158 RepID=UPI003F7B8939
MSKRHGLILYVIIGICRLGCSSTLNYLTTALINDYEPSVRPVGPGFETTQVTVDMAIRQLISLNEPEQVALFNIWMRLGWNDCHLVWNPDAFDGIESIVLPVSLIWKPDITLYNSISEEFYGFDSFRALIHFDGNVTYNFPTKVEASCPIDVSRFPFDRQVCDLMFGSWVYNGFQLNVTSRQSNADLSSVKENVEFIIDNAPIVRHELYYGCCAHPFPDVTVYIHLTRKPDYYITNIIIPSVLVTVVASFGFLLPVDSGEKVGLELTVMLAMSVFQLLVADQLPPSADSTPWIAMFFTFTLVLSGGSSLWQVIVLNIHHRGHRKMPAWLKSFILRPLAYVTCVSLPNSVHPFQHSNKQDNTKRQLCQAECNGRSNGQQTVQFTGDYYDDDSEFWIQFALVLDRVGLFVFLISFAIGCSYIFLGIKSKSHEGL